MPRIAIPSRPGGFARVVFWFTRRMLGKVPTPLRVTAASRPVFRGLVAMERHRQRGQKLPAELESLVSLRVAAVVGCPH